MTDDIFVYIVDLPDSVNEVVAPCNLGFTVYLNAKLGYQGRVKAYTHALKHIENNDLESNEDINTIECIAHKE